MKKILLPIFIFSCFPAFAQIAADTTFLTVSKANTARLYHNAIRSQSRLFNGSKYLGPRQTFEEHPYFLSEDWITGGVRYDGEVFQDVPLMYDLLNDVLVTEHAPSGHAIALVRQKLDNFYLANHFFEKILNETVSNSLPKSGFYDVLYAGETKVVALRQKSLREKIEVREVIITYEEKNRYFLLRNGVYFQVKSKASALSLMEDRKQELKRFIKEQKISFPDNRELALGKMAEYYDSLK